jgi:cytochrome bd ubiquinol oxidase subunit II
MDRWLERPYLLVFPVIGAVAAAFLIIGIRRRIDQYPLPMTIVIFVSAFATLAASFWPYMIPFAVTIEEAASPLSSLRFMFWGAGLVALPLTLIYTVAVYRIFSGKLVNDEAYEDAFNLMGRAEDHARWATITRRPTLPQHNHVEGIFR